jgi:hypothetical protein
MSRKIRYRRKPCPICRDLVTTNALGRSAHIRSCTFKNSAAAKEIGRPYPKITEPRQ